MIQQTTTFHTELFASVDEQTEQQADAPEADAQEEPPGTAQASTDPGGDGPVNQVGEDGDEEKAGHPLPLDQIFEILKNSRRRETLRYLEENGGETTLSEVAEHIAALENDTTVRAISSAQRKRVYVGLYQCHLPKMDDTNVVDFDQNRGTIEIGPNAEQLKPYLDNPKEREWYKLYMGVAVAGGGLFAATQVGGSTFGLTPTVVLLWVLAAIGVCVIAHYVTDTEKLDELQYDVPLSSSDP